ncbi:unnamed protein product [Rangifer tarandus platyrhynchus]|uniref:Uncharacterized protein n=1 Tax=Rangifer tarandus platyrhynchus TaxID=3082113 RepID=A0ABN9A7Q2_RANTA|nr:unnamed protein product [Rangifer tarandus platyrhynchus]
MFCLAVISNILKLCFSSCVGDTWGADFIYIYIWGFPGSSADKESAFNAGDPGWISGLGRDRLTISVFLGFPGGSDGKKSACNVGDLGSVLGLGRSPGGGHGDPLWYSCLENPHGQRSLAGYSHKELDMTEQLSTAQHI